jgi:hypothetical protein
MVDKELNELFNAIKKILGESLIVEAIAVYDCLATEDSNCYLIRNHADAGDLIALFKEESGPVLRWFDPYGDRAMDDLDLLPEGMVPRGPVKRGAAFIMSSDNFSRLKAEVQPELLPTVYFLNAEVSNG